MEGDALLTEIRRIRENFELHQDLSDKIVDKEALKESLERLKYAELLASQPESGHQVAREALTVADVHASDGRQPTGVDDDATGENAPEGALTEQQQS